MVDQVAERLRQGIRSRRWIESMPGRSRLAEELGVSSSTVIRALSLLENEGLLVSGGPGKKRKIVEGSVDSESRSLRVALMLFDRQHRATDFISELLHQLEEAGHIPFIAEKTVLDLGQDSKVISRYVESVSADAWMITNGSHDLLKMMIEKQVPTFALFGCHDCLSIAGARPDKSPMVTKITQQLINLRHRRIVFICRHFVRSPGPTKLVVDYLKVLEEANIRVGEYNLPRWEESKEGLARLLESLYRHTPPTALIFDEAHLFNAGFHFLSQKRLIVPQDVSLVALEEDPDLRWCQPPITHVRWDHSKLITPVVRWASKIANGKEDLRQVLTSAELIEGGTVGPAALKYV